MTAEPCSNYSGNSSSCDHQQALAQQHTSQPQRCGPKSHAHAHLLCSLRDGTRNDAVDANHRQQERESGENPDSAAVKFRPGEHFIQPLLHGFRAEHGNLRVHRLDRVADFREVIFRPAIHPRHESREKAAGGCRRQEDLISIHHRRIGLILHGLDDANDS